MWSAWAAIGWVDSTAELLALVKVEVQGQDGDMAQFLLRDLSLASRRSPSHCVLM